MRNLKGIDLKVPAVFRDLYQDLRDRRLLPLVVLLLVAIAAVPILLSDSGASEEEAPRPAAKAPRSEEASASVAVVRAVPGLRQPSKRLKHRKPEDPFKQKYVSPPLSEKPVTVESTPSGAGEGGGSGGAPSDAPPASPASVRSELVFYATAVTLKIIRIETKDDGEVVKEDPVVRSRVLPSTTLLGEKAQVVTYMGPSPKTRNPTFLISDQVTAVFGEGKCLAGTERCQLIELREGEPELFEYGSNGVRYKFTVLGTEIVETGRTPKP